MRRDRIEWLVNAIVVPLASVAAGFVVAGVAVAATGADPLAAFIALFQGAITNRNAFPETLVSTVPYVFLGLGVALGFRAGLFNIGAEGQFYIGALSGVFTRVLRPRPARGHRSSACATGWYGRRICVVGDCRVLEGPLRGA